MSSPVSQSKGYIFANSNKSLRGLKHSPRSGNNIITSYGIACVRKNQNSGCYEIVMIKKRYTYEFIEFVRGMYDPYKDHDIEYLFDRMTITEKSMIQSRNFDTIWNYCNGGPANNGERSLYTRANRKFNTFMSRDVNILEMLINNTTNASLLWEIPKGRQDKNEAPLMSAVREFEEEVGLKKNAYRILFDEGIIEYSFIDNNVKYKYVYYLAVLNQGVQPKYNYSNKHMLREVSDIKLMTAVATQELNNKRFAKLVRIIIKKCKKYI